jgi:hypothetical protein
MKRSIGWALGVCLVGGSAYLGLASSHREAPLISADPLADNTDTYAFVSPDAPHVILRTDSPKRPAAADLYLGDDAYPGVDNDGDAKDDIVYEFRFKGAFRTRRRSC